MSDKNNNLELWNAVEQTDPDYTKKANVKGLKITAIDPQYQIKNATSQFGKYGGTWGLKDTSLDYSLFEQTGIIVYKATFFYPNGEFSIYNSVSAFMDNARAKVDVNFTKKVETDTLTKALSKLGFNSDVFLGKFDDVSYAELVTDSIKRRQVELNNKKEIEDLKSAKTVDELGDKYKSLTPKQKKDLKELVTEMKLELENKG